VPTYDYQCRACGSVTEVIHSMLEDGPSACEQCGGELRRVLYPTGIIFKGSGFYRTDSRSTSSGEKARTSSKTPAASPRSGDGSGGSGGDKSAAEPSAT
jgi:putative FmdB family regulatory protein